MGIRIHSFIFAEHFYKPVWVLEGDEINICVTNFFSITDDCNSRTFNNNLMADVFANIDEQVKKSQLFENNDKVTTT